MNTRPDLEDLFSSLFHSAVLTSASPARAEASTQDDHLDKTAASRGTAREVVEARPDDLKIPAAPNTTTGGQSGGKSNK